MLWYYKIRSQMFTNDKEPKWKGLSVLKSQSDQQQIINPMKTDNKETPFSYLNIVVLILSIYVLGALLVDTIFNLPPEVSKLLNLMDNFICGIFFIDVILRFFNAENKWKFMRWGWIDLLSSIPVSYTHLTLPTILRV